MTLVNGNLVKQSDCPNYTEYCVTVDGLPTGLSIKAEKLIEAQRKLVVASQRLGFSAEDASLSER
jgi:hypothetical protein